MIAITSLCVMIAAVYVLSVITDKFFIISLDEISNIWKLPSDVAGASLMAVGSSAPELSIALFSLFKEGGAHSDVGVGTIVGSAVFNILVITGVSAIIREAKITLPAVVRDTVFYLLSIVLILVIFWDARVTATECFVLLTIYAIYIGILFFFSGSEKDDFEKEDKEEKENINNWFARFNKIIINIVGRLAGDASKNYIRAFFVSIIFISGLSWILVDTAVTFANAVGIPPVIVALTILAGGTSAPDLISSAMVAKQGRGGMAISNAIGSNIFDILVGLGLPWLVALMFLGKQVINVGTEDLFLSVFILMATVVILFIFLFTGRVLSKKEGWCLIGLYVAYVTWTVATSP